MAEENNIKAKVSIEGADEAVRALNAVASAAKALESNLKGNKEEFEGSLSGAVTKGNIYAEAIKQVFEKIKHTVQHNMSEARQISSLAIRFNVDASTVHSMKIAADDAGVSVRSLIMGMKQLSKAAEKAGDNKDMANNFKQLGIAAEQFSEIQAKPAKFLPDIAVALSHIANENERAAAGQMLLGRGYQQMKPLLEELAESAEKRASFLENESAMTNEQVEANKRLKLVISDLETGLKKLVAQGSPILEWTAAWVSLLKRGLDYVNGIFNKTNAEKEQERTEKREKITEGINDYAENLNKRSTTWFKSGSKEDYELAKKVEAEGGVERMVARQAALAAAYMGEVRKAELSGQRVTPEMEKIWGQIDPEFRKRVFPTRDIKGWTKKGYGVVGQELVTSTKDFGSADFLKAAEMAAKAGESRGQGGEYAGVIEGMRNEEARAAAKAAKAVREQKDAAAKKSLNTWATIASPMMALIAPDKVWDYGSEDYQPGWVTKAEKERRDEERALKEDRQKSGRYQEDKERRQVAGKQRRSMFGYAKAQIDLYYADTKDVEKAEGGVVKAKESVTEAETNAAEGRKDVASAEEALASKKKAMDAIKDKFSSKYTSAKAEADDAQKNLVAATNKQLELEAQILRTKADQIRAEQALAQAKEAAWAKERREREQSVGDDEKFEKEANNLKYRLMKEAGKSEKEISEQKFKDDMDAYERALAEKAELEKNIDLQRAGRWGRGGDSEMTDAEKEAIRRAEARVDATRQGVQGSALDMLFRQPSKPIVSELGRMGGGSAVQWNANPVDEIRKTNEILTKIYQAVGGNNSAMALTNGAFVPVSRFGPSNTPQR